jgi:hypothetical protein
MKAINLHAIAASMTNTRARDWSFAQGPDSGVGQDYWLTHKSGLTFYANCDQGEWSYEVVGEDD